MKKKTICFISTFIILILGSCNNTADISTGEMGKISIAISNSQSRTIHSDDSLTASANSNKYEVLIYNNSTMLTAIADLSGGTATLPVEAGDYTVLILAGYSNSSEGVLLGSGFQESVTVVSDEITDVSITLTSISHDFSVPAEAACSDQYTVSLTGSTNNQLLQISSGGTVMENRPYLEMEGNATNIYLDCTVTGPDWTGTMTLTAPLQAESTSIKLYGSNIKLIDPAYSIDDDLKNIGSVNWKWLNESLIPDTITGEVNKSIEFSTATSGVNVTVGWG